MVHSRIRELVSIPLKSGRCCKIDEVFIEAVIGLNPFEVREVLQDEESGYTHFFEVSQSL